MLDHVIASGYLHRLRLRDDWRDRTLAMIAFFLSVIAAGHRTSASFTLDKLLPPYLASRRTVAKTPEQRLKEAQLRQRQREAKARRDR